MNSKEISVYYIKFPSFYTVLLPCLEKKFQSLPTFFITEISLIFWASIKKPGGAILPLN